MIQLTPHRRQFLISTAPHDRPGWTSLPIGQGLILSHCRSLPLTVVQRGRGEAIVLGIAIADPAGPEPQDALASAERVDERLYEGWFGRWVLIAEGEIHPDAGASLPIFYTRDSDGKALVSSSVALLQEITGRPSKTAWKPNHLCLLNWIPGPSSGFPSTSRLLPTGVLNLRSVFAGTGEPVRGRQHIRSDLHAGDADAILDELRSRFTGGMTGASRRFAEVVVPVSGGADSRTVLAAAIAAGVRPETFTFHKSFRSHGREIVAGDARLPRVMAKLLGLKHRYIRPGPRDRQRDAVIHEHTAGRVDDIDPHYIANGQWDRAPAKGVIVRGGLFGLGKRRSLEKWLTPAYEQGSLDFTTALLERVNARHFYGDTGPLRDAIEEWVQWTEVAPLPGVDLVDRLQLDQRIGCWTGDVEQTLDLVPGERFHLANNARVLSLFLSLPLELRRSGEYQGRLIRSLAPQLAEVPMNPPETRLQVFLRRTRFRVHRAEQKLRKAAGRSR